MFDPRFVTLTGGQIRRAPKAADVLEQCGRRVADLMQVHVGKFADDERGLRKGQEGKHTAEHVEFRPFCVDLDQPDPVPPTSE